MSIISAMIGSGAKLVQLPANISRDSTKLFPTDSSAGMRLHTDGTIDATPNNSTILTYSDDLGAWLLAGANSDYEARMTSGGPDAWSGSAVGSWLVLSTIRAWYAQVTGAGIQSCSGTLEIRHAVSLVILASCSVSMYAESN